MSTQPNHIAMSWSPDSTQLLGRHRETGEVAIIPIDGSPPHVIGEVDCAEWVDVAPESDLIAGYSTPPSTSYVYVSEEASELSLFDELYSENEPLGQVVAGNYYEFLDATFLSVKIRTSRGDGWIRSEGVEVTIVEDQQINDEELLENFAEALPVAEYYIAPQYEHYELFFTRLQELRSDANTALSIANLLVLDVSSALDIACAIVPTLELSREVIEGVPSAPDLEDTQSFLCMSIDIVDGLVRGVDVAGPGGVLSLLEILINADEVAIKLGTTVDEWGLDNLNQLLWNTPFTCLLFPDAPICPPR